MWLCHQCSQSMPVAAGVTLTSLSASFPQKISAVTDCPCLITLNWKLVHKFEKWCFVCWLLYNTGQCCLFNVSVLCVPYRKYHHQKQSINQSINQSIGMNRMQWFLAVLRSLLHSSLSYTFSCHSSPPTILPSSLTSAIYFLVYLLVLLFTNSCTIHFWESYFLPFSVHVQTNVIYAALLSLL